MRLLDYECKTTFWKDFSIAERFGAEAIRDTYKRVRAEWKNDRAYGTELSMALNHKVGIGTKNKTKHLVGYMLNFRKSGMSGCWITGGVKIWGII